MWSLLGRFFRHSTNEGGFERVDTANDRIAIKLIPSDGESFFGCA